METDDLVALAGRLLLAFLFLAFAFGKITNFEGTVAFMDSHGVPWPPLACAASIAVETLGGMALLLGFQARLGAGLLAGFVAAATFALHTSPDQRIHLLKNVAIIGGLLQVVAYGPGGFSLEGRRP